MDSSGNIFRSIGIILNSGSTLVIDKVLVIRPSIQLWVTSKKKQNRDGKLDYLTQDA